MNRTLYSNKYSDIDKLYYKYDDAYLIDDSPKKDYPKFTIPNIQKKRTSIIQKFLNLFKSEPEKDQENDSIEQIANDMFSDRIKETQEIQKLESDKILFSIEVRNNNELPLELNNIILGYCQY